MKIIALCLALFLAAGAFATDSTLPAATAINLFGLDLLRNAAKPDTNALYSPYSIELTLVMTYAGANGVTRDEMAKTLHFGTNEMEVHRSFTQLRTQLEGMMQRSAKAAAEQKDKGIVTVADPITFVTANRVFGAPGYSFRGAFMDCLRTNYKAPLLELDFARDPARATRLINDAVSADTKLRIPSLIPEGVLNVDTCVVLVNAVYLKAPWVKPFGGVHRTNAPPFHLGLNGVADVPMMWNRGTFGYQKYNGFTAVSVPYSGNELQFLILLPDATNGMQGLEARLTQISSCASLPVREIILEMPKFKIDPPSVSLKPFLRGLGMKSAFDKSADFSRMAKEDIFITDAFHKTFLNIDEKGTEAAAATAVFAGTGIEPKVMVVTVDRPFIFAIQHRASGACLFLGHVVDPR